MLTKRKNRCVLQLAKTIQGFLEALLILQLTGKNFIAECFVSGVMGLLPLRLGPAGLLALMLIQGFLLAAYPAEYKDEPRWYALVGSYAPSIIVPLHRMADVFRCGCSTRHFFDGLSTYGFCTCVADWYLALPSC